MTDNKTHLEKTHQDFIDTVMMKLPASRLDEIAIPDVMGYGTTVEEKIFELEGLKQVVELQMKQTEHIQFVFSAVPVYRRITNGENTAIFVDEINAGLTMEEGRNELLVRLTSVYEMIGKQWKLVHWHGSTGVETQADPFHLEEWKQLNKKLQKQVDEKTAELKNKNHELEIEAALERVRAVAMGMQKSDDILDVCKVISEQLEKLNISHIRNTQVAIVKESNKTYLNYQYFTPYAKKVFEETEYENNPTSMEMVVELQKSANSFFTGSMRDKELEKFKNWRKKYKQFPDPKLDDCPEIFYYFYSIGQGGLGLTTYQKISKDDLEIFKRFHKVFRLAYQRYTEIEKAKAQAREAQIEASLERVRAVAMAMHKPADLSSIGRTIFADLKLLGFESIRNAEILINNDERESVTSYHYSDYGKEEIIEIGYKENPIVKKWAEDIKKAEDAFVPVSIPKKDIKSWDRYRSEIGYKSDPKMASANSVHYYSYSTGLGALSISTWQELSNEQIKILERFRNVFKLSYQRFKDIESAEAQAREAQIEAALERVRSQSMGMQSSEDLSKVTSVMFDQLRMLGGELFAAGIVLCDKHEGHVEQWHSIPNAGMITPFIVPIDLDKVHQYRYDQWKKGTELFSIEIEEDFIEQHFKTLFDLPSVKIVLKDFEERGTPMPGPPPWEIDYGASFKYGYLLVSALKPFEDKHILPRFAKVFEQTYTRFLDLQKAEAQAREAQIEVALERVRSRTMGMQKSEELKEVIQIIFEQFALLNINAEHAGIVVDFEEKKDFHFWVADSQDIPSKITVPYLDLVWDKQFTEAKKKGKAFFTTRLNFEEKNSFYKALLPHIQGLAKKAQDFYFSCPGLAASTVIEQDIGLYIENFSGTPYSNEENAILMRFGKSFQQTYTRFLDLKKAEAQARESQIEAALEKVRSRSLAMQSADELGEVVNVIVEKLTHLGVVLDANGVVLCTYFQNSKDVLHWIASPDVSFAGSYLLPYFDHPIFVDTWQSKESGDEYFSKAYSIDEKNSFFQYAFEHSDYRNFPDEFKEWVFQNDKHILSFAWQKNSAILIPSHTGVVPSDIEVAILKRFAKVFEQAYVRFMDLQKAEAQARETQVELSLERIRAKVTAMQESTDLLDIVVSMRTEFVSLGHEAHYFWYMSWLPEKYEKAMTSGDGTKIGMIMTLPRHIHGDIKLVADWEKSNEPAVILAMDTETAVDYIEKMITLGDFQQVDPHAPTLDDIRHIGGLTFIMARTKHGEIGFSLPGPVPDPPQESVDTLVRFAGVFDLAYSRFEDLKKAEYRNRETQIELALERSRNQSMLMQHSDELNKTSEVFHEQLELLGIDSEFSYLWLPDEPKNEHLFWATWHEDKKGKQNFKNKVVTYPLDKTEPSIAECYIAWESGVRVHINPVAPEGVEDYFATWDELLHGVEKFKPELFPEGIYYVDAYMKYGCFGIMIKRQITKEEEKILGRFAIEFERAYTRFLDLKKAEAQAREAQIEAALERVRSRTIGMHRSVELQETAMLLFQQVEALGVPVFSSGFNIWDKNQKHATAWMAGKDRLQQPFKTSSSKDVFLRIRKAAEQGETLFVEEQGGDALKQHYEYLNSIPVFKEIAEKMAKAGQSFPTFQIVHCAYFSQGYLMFISFEPVPNDYDIFTRFAKVFDQAYIRFLDLQKAEAQAKEAIKQASLDRVRAQIASMRSTDDLQRITPLIWHELETLDVPFKRCGVFIVDEKASMVQVYLTTPDAKPLAMLNMPTDANELTQKTVEHWRKKSVFKQHWNKNDFVNWAKSMVDLGQVQTQQEYQGDATPPETLELHFIPFSQGMLYVGNSEPLSEDKIDLVKSLAKAFSVAYARYEDFKLLEDAKNKIEITLNDLKAAQTQLIHAEKMASLGELTAGIAHEIQNPLNFVNNFSEVNAELITELLEEIARGDLEEVKAIAKDIGGNEEKIIHHGRRAEAIVKGMLQHSRGSSKDKQETDINALADEYLRLSYHGLRAKDKSFNADFVMNADKNLPKVNVIAQDIGRVLLNLINNAFYAVSEKAKQNEQGYKPTVTVSTKVKNRNIEIHVRDNGSGIPESIKDKIFQPFFTTKPTGQGTGLGLSMSYDIVKKGHGGELKVESKPGEGSVFIIQLNN